ncbi:hypothetical protein MPL3365_130522 [Mesorhizobium plurifarium]|uniref:Uncharacterized protein n=1 Tax=Mesorhizobium plurifarium TaxID=69974 RepID=A0A090GSY5_MESPL|nr:hypothetical protein MPL3365_130522 [Mesorhizobium plurifarium]
MGFSQALLALRRDPVYVLLVDGRAVGFLDGYDIMEIRSNLRGAVMGACSQSSWLDLPPRRDAPSSKSR